MTEPLRIGFIGMGNMAQALCAGFLKGGMVGRDDVSAYAPHQERLRSNAAQIGFRPVSSLGELADRSDLLFVACKPYQIEDAFTELGAALRDKAVVSVAAGWTLSRFRELLRRLGDAVGEPLADSVRVQQLCPNTPAMVEAGVFLLEAEHTLTGEEHAFLLRLLEPLGMVREMPGHLLDIGSAVTGCSPAFVDLFLEAYADAAVKYGIPRSEAYPLIAQAILGAAKLQLATGEHPAVLKDKVCSPAGTTIRGIQALEDHGLRAACMASVDAVMQKR